MYAIILIILQILDTASTHELLSRGVAYELNPLGAYSMTLLWTLKAAATGLAIVLYYAVPAARKWLWWGVAPMVLVLAWHIAVWAQI